MEQIYVNPLGAIAQAQGLISNQKQNRLADLQYQQTQAALTKQNRLAELMPQAMKGDQTALQEVGQLDYDLFSKLDENQRSVAAERSKKMGSLLASVMSVPEELRPLAYNQAAQIAVSDLGVDAAQIPPYDPARVKLWSDQHRQIEDILAKPKMGAFEEKLHLAGIDPTTPEGQQMARDILTKPQTQISIGGDKKEQEKLAESRVRRFETLQTSAMAASEMNDRLDQLSNMDVQTGFGEQGKTQMARVFNALGVDGDKLLGVNVASAQAFNAVSGQLLAEALASQKGPQTDRDAERIQATLPNIGNEAMANRFIVTSLKAVNQRRIEQAQFYESYLDENGTLKGADAEWEQFKRQTPLVSDNVKDPQTGLPMFYHEFRDRAMQANPGATEEQIISAWRKMAKG